MTYGHQGNNKKSYLFLFQTILFLFMHLPAHYKCISGEQIILGTYQEAVSRK